MSSPRAVEVDYYAGCRGEETPRRVHLGDRLIDRTTQQPPAAIQPLRLNPERTDR